MLKLEENPKAYDGRTMADQFAEDGATTLREKVESAISLVKTLPLDGCITGSCLLPGFDPEGWGTVPDVDVFVFGEGAHHGEHHHHSQKSRKDFLHYGFLL